MQMINKITGRDVSAEYSGVIDGLITEGEFMEITCTHGAMDFVFKHEDIVVECSADQDWAWHYESE
tara:strand:- start:710 stop:907 length:198 start_codon:yes stop_codon:yes gene_type:complete